MERIAETGKQHEPTAAAVNHSRNAAPSAASLPPELQLQQMVGNQAMQEFLRSGYIQAKLAISNPDDPEEREADHVASTIMRKAAGSPSSSPCACSHDGEMCEECQQKQSQPTISRRASAPSAPSHVPRIVSDVLRSPGHPLDSATRAFFEPRFNHDFSHVRIHTGPEAATSARSINAYAYTVGNNVVFGSGHYQPHSQDGQSLLAHELAHTMGKGGVSSFALGVSFPARDPIFRQSTPKKISNSVDHWGDSFVQRFASPEHRELGDAAAPGVTSDINVGSRFLTFGEVVALAGDYFFSIEQMYDLSKTPGGQEQLQWALFLALGGPRPPVSEDSKKKVSDRYFTLAATNISHFSAGGTAKLTYENVHIQALRAAWDSGRTNDSSLWTKAQTTEAFAQHYLSDMFAAGHVRTPRQAIKTWYDAHFPDSITLFVAYIARFIHQRLVAQHGIADFFGFVPSEADLANTIRSLGGAAIAAFSLGDIVSLAMHDKDNLGLDVVADVDPSGKQVAGGFHWKATGDNNLASSPTTKTMAVAAMKTSLDDLDKLQKMGVGVTVGVMSSIFVQALKTVMPFSAERFIPREDTSSTTNAVMDWHWGTFNAVMRTEVDKAIKGTVANTLQDKAAAVTNADARAALLEFVQRLRTNGISEVEAAIGVKAN